MATADSPANCSAHAGTNGAAACAAAPDLETAAPMSAAGVPDQPCCGGGGERDSDGETAGCAAAAAAAAHDSCGSSAADAIDLDRDRIIAYLRRHIHQIPHPYTSMHSQRVTLLQFILGALALLGALDEIVGPEETAALIEWVYSLESPEGGFCGAPKLPKPDIASTYSALACLRMLGDPLARVSRERMARFLAATWRAAPALPGAVPGYVQFADAPATTPTDTRFTYCACCVRALLDMPPTDTERDAIVAAVLACQTHEGGIAVTSQTEAHGGYTFCAVAALSLLGALDGPACAALGDPRDPRTRAGALVAWCVRRQEVGFAGRAGKPGDTCYAFWVGAALRLLGHAHAVDVPNVARFMADVQHDTHGGLAKDDSSYPDLLHTYLGMAALAAVRPETTGDTEEAAGRPRTYPGAKDNGTIARLASLDVALNIPRTFRRAPAPAPAAAAAAAAPAAATNKPEVNPAAAASPSGRPLHVSLYL